MLKSAVKYICVAMIALAGSGTVARGEWEFQESGVTHDLWDVCFIDEYTGWAVGGTSILKTNDGGKTWVQKIFRVCLLLRKT